MNMRHFGPSSIMVSDVRLNGKINFEFRGGRKKCRILGGEMMGTPVGKDEIGKMKDETGRGGKR